MTAWMGAMFVGFLVIGLGRDRSPHRAHWLAFGVIIVVLGFQAARTHAI